MLHKYGILTTLPFSKYASPIFAQKKPKGKLRLLVDLRKINNLISDDYINNNHPVSTLVDAAQHMAGKKLFCKLDWSRAYPCLQMADKRSIEMLAFNFASSTFAYLRLTQGLSRSLSAFSSFMREYLDKVIKADQCAQYVDDIGIADNDADHLIANLRARFRCIQKAGLKLTMHKCHFGAREIDFLGRTITHKASNPKGRMFRTSLRKQNSQSRKKLCRDIWASWTTTELISQDCRNALLHSIRCWKVTKKSWYRKIGTTIWGNQQSTRQMLRLGPSTTHSEQANRANDWCKFWRSRIRSLDRRWPESEIFITQEVKSSGGLQFKNLHPSADKNVYLCRGIPCNLLCI